jgi:hypothetical protein
MNSELILRSPVKRSEDGRLEGWQPAVCARWFETREDALLTMRQRSYFA